MVQPMISDDELFCLFEKAFGPHDNIAAKELFIKDILRRYKAMGEPVCEWRVFCIDALCRLSYSTLLICRRAISFPHMHHLLHLQTT